MIWSFFLCQPAEPPQICGVSQKFPGWIVQRWKNTSKKILTWWTVWWGHSQSCDSCVEFDEGILNETGGVFFYFLGGRWFKHRFWRTVESWENPGRLLGKLWKVVVEFWEVGTMLETPRKIHKKVRKFQKRSCIQRRVSQFLVDDPPRHFFPTSILVNTIPSMRLLSRDMHWFPRCPPMRSKTGT